MTRDRSLDVAVTGVAARFPGAGDLSAWWSALKAGRVLTRRYERRELADAGVAASLLDDPDFVPVHGHLADADRFDNTLFRVSPRDAEMMDPQHRLMLEVTWSALEDAGIPPLGPAPVTGVYASASGSGYLRAMLANGGLDPLTLEDALHGAEPDFMAGLVSYKIGLTGPAVAVQTACSSSLVAVHTAVQALLNGDCDQAVVVAAGMAFPQAGHLHVPGGVHSASGHCRPFDERADGVVAGSGAACVVLRRLEDALADGPEPYGVILGTAVNNDGAAKAGYYAPSVGGQEAVIRAALRAADVTGESIGYLETHGTGTRVGDPIEWSAASAALAGTGARPGQVAVGAVKANVGHLDNAAGLAALIKTLLVVRDGVIPPVAAFTRSNPLLETDGSPLYVPTREQPWTGPGPRRAGVSSFGIGGTNAHVVLEQPPAGTGPGARTDAGGHDAAYDGREPVGRTVLLSAAGPEALTRAAARLSAHLAQRPAPLADVAFTLAAGRAELPERLAVSGRTTAEVADRLATGSGVVRASRPAAGPAPALFLFPGQGTQFPGMGLPFAQALPGFADALESCLGAFGPAMAVRLRAALLDPAFPEAELTATELAQPALFALEYAAAGALSALGVAPAAVAGHSLGEITAACAAGVLALPDAARFVVARGRAMQDCPPGAMLVLGCAEDHARELLAAFGPGLELAAVNTPDSCVAAGTADAVEAFRERVGNRVHTRRMRGDRAFHSALVEPALPALAAALAGTVTSRPVLPFAANTTGRIVPAGTPVATEMFVEQARGTVRFLEAARALAEHFPGALAVEIGPGRALTAMADAAGLTAVPLSPSRTAHPAGELLTALGALWTHGQPVEPTALSGPGRRTHLPGYAFAGPRWLAPEAAGTAGAATREAAAVSAGAEDRPAADAPTAAPAPPPDAPSLVAGLWAELLGHGELTEDADFFALGGDSLLITHLARRIRTASGVQVPVRDMLLARTLGRQTAIVAGLLAQTEPTGPESAGPEPTGQDPAGPESARTGRTPVPADA
ncbi:type I polyketide synthase [Streptomyces sp. MST-110588]|uniref:type I polyketide synthase n=1 Tax=Streptomyces sp. MST-110588 TaxID=2833628 RepID=UPI001F5DBA31|nr:type I polyketide synthase [Streptomyces sp. MST-110588]UNO39192.1 acyltransferase domain-containing protein [Streptomyces sp. MST-110588]